jgi:hypothetical protein
MSGAAGGAAVGPAGRRREQQPAPRRAGGRPPGGGERRERRRGDRAASRRAEPEGARRRGAAGFPAAGPAYAAAGWALLFALANVYWALGGRLAVPLADAAAALAEPSVAAANRAAVALKLGMAVVAVATVQPWGERVPRRLLLLAAFGLGAGLTVYGGLGLVFDALRAAGALPASEATRAVLGLHLLLWDPVWLLGGVLFLATGEGYRRRRR